MTDQRFDKIHIRDLHGRCIIGIYPEERRQKQDVILNITLYLDLSRAGASDRIEDTLDYKTLKKDVLALVEASEFNLIEKLAQAVAGRCLEDPEVQQVAVTVDKPAALRFARSVAVELTRTRKGHG